MLYSGSSKSHLVSFPAILWKQSAYLSTSHLWVLTGTWQKRVLGAKGQERLKQDRVSSRCAVGSQWRWSHTLEVHQCRCAGMWLQGQAELEAGSVAAGANIVSVWLVCYWQPAQSRVKGADWSSSKLQEKQITTAEPVGVSCYYNNT